LGLMLVCAGGATVCGAVDVPVVVGVRVGAGVAILVAVCVGDAGAVAVDVGITACVAVGVLVGVAAARRVAVAVAVGVAVGVDAAGVFVAVGAGVAVAAGMATLTLKMAVLAFVPSDAVTGWLPAVTAGTVNAQKLRLPLALVAQDVATLLPLNLTVMGANGAKPLPLTAAVLPPAPALGIRLMAELTVKVALPEYVPSDTVTVWGPAVVAGTVNAQVLLASR
jgi:hypothetical protein